jgi:hypothetical protein
MGFHRKSLFLLLFAFFLVTVVFSVQIHKATASPLPSRDGRVQLEPSQILQNSVSETVDLPEAAQDTCQHCHLEGEITTLWTPISRWSVFAVAGFAFLFGSYQTGSVILKRQPWKPLWLQTVEWLDQRYEFVDPLMKILKKPVPMFATRWWYCLGGITFLLFVVQGVTGILLAFYYKPSPEEAYASIQFIETQVQFGAGIRAIHHWAANGMVLMVVAHLLRVFITGAFKPPRELNWISGVFLFVLTLLFGLTGYLLPWDQRAFWATTVATEIAGGVPIVGDLALVFLRGGWDVSGITLSRFFALHVLVLPVASIVLLGMHFIMIRKQGIAKPL